MSAYTVRYERDDEGWWVASVLEVAGCRTQARSIPQARERIREALSLFVRNASKAELHDDVVLPSWIRSVVDKRKSAMRQLEKLQEKEQSNLRIAAKSLVTEMGLSTRDAGAVLQLSQHRVQQVVARSGAKFAAKPKKAAARFASTRKRRPTSTHSK